MSIPCAPRNAPGYRAGLAHCPRFCRPSAWSWQGVISRCSIWTVGRYYPSPATSHSRSFVTVERWKSTGRPSLSRHTRGVAAQREYNCARSVPPLWSSKPRGTQRSTLSHPAMTIDTRNLDSIDIAPVQLAIAMAILGEMAVNTVHAFFKVDVFHVHRNSSALFGAIGRFTDSALQERSSDRLKGMTAPLASRKLPLRSRLKTALKFQPWP